MDGEEIRGGAEGMSRGGSESRWNMGRRMGWRRREGKG